MKPVRHRVSVAGLIESVLYNLLLQTCVNICDQWKRIGKIKNVQQNSRKIS